MKKIIKGKLYDTEKAALLHEWSNTANVRDFSHFTENLYKTAKGSYFLHGQGGPASPYAVKVDTNSYSGGEAITPMAETEVVKWLEDNEGDEVILNSFADHVQEA